MKYPILYKSNETDFFAMGLGPIQMLKATVTQERNGIFIFEGEILTDNPLFPLVLENCIIKVDADHLLKDQRFRIKRIVPNHNGKAEIYAEHVSYLSRELTIKPEVNIAGSAQVALNQWKSSIVESNPFIVSSDITTSASTKWRIDKVSNPMMALGGVEGSILDHWGGEYLFDNYHIRLLKKRGTTAQTILAYGRNITDFEQERNILSTYTSVAPYAIYTDDNEKEIIVTIDGYVVDSERVDKYPNRVTKPIDFSSEFGSGEIPTKARLTTLAQQYIADNEIGVPTTSIKISFLDLSQTADYADYAFLEQVNLCDDVRVHYPKLGVNTIAKVIRTVWNVLTESYDEIEIGQKRMSLIGQMQQQQQAIKEINMQTNYAMTSADGKNTIFYGLYGENGLGEPKAIKVGDTWYKPNGTGTDMLVWTGTIWQVVLNAETFNQINEKIDQAEKDIAQNIIDIESALDKATQAELDAGFSKDLAEEAKALGVTASSLASEAKTNANTAMADAQEAIRQAGITGGVAADASADATEAKRLAGLAEGNAQEALTKANSSVTDASKALTDATKAFNKSFKSSTIAYATSTNGSTPPSTGWGTTVPTPSPDVYIWTRTTILLNDNTPVVSYSVGKIGAKGDQGSKGDTGGQGIQGIPGVNAPTIKSVVQQFYLSTSKTAQTGGSWLSTVPVWSSGKYYWVRVVTTYSNDTTSTSTPVLDNAINDSLVTALEVKTANQSLSTTVTQHATLIEGKANTTTVDAIAGRVTTAEGSISTIAGQVELKANSTDVQTLTGRVTTAEGKITTQAGQIALKANTTTVSALTGRVSAAESALTVQSGKIDLAATKTELTTAIDGVEIGGRNLLVGSKDYTGTWVHKALWTVSSDTHKGTLIASRTGAWNGIGQRLNVFKGEQYTFSAYVKSTSTSVMLYVANQSDSAGLTPTSKFITLEPNTWTYVVCVISVSSDGIMFPRFEQTSDVESVYVSAMKLERGNKVTDWTPAPEDVDKAISTVQANLTVEAGKIASKVSQTDFDALNGRVGTAESTITQNTIAINLRATKTDVNALTGRVATAEGNITTQAGQIALKANQSTVNTLTGRVSTAEASIVTNANAIKLKANQTEVNTLTGTVNSLDSQLKLEAGKITALNSKTDGHTTQIGSLESSFSGLNRTVAEVQSDLSKKVTDLKYRTSHTGKSSMNKWTKFARSIISSRYSDVGVGFDIVANGSGDSSVVTGELYVRQKQQAAMGGNTLISISLINSSSPDKLSKDDFVAVVVQNDSNAVIVDYYVRIRITYTILNFTPFNQVGSGKLEFTPIQPFLDNYPSGVDGSPIVAKEQGTLGITSEQTVKITAIEETVDGIKATVKNKAEQSQVTQLAGQWSATVAKVDGHTTQITSMGTQINLRATKADLISQINISPESILIASKKIQIKGDTYIENSVIKTAHIADLAVSGAKIANASISSAKIISLDASKINVGTLTGHTLNGGKITGGTITGANITGGTFYNSGTRGDFHVYDGMVRATSYNVVPDGTFLSESGYVTLRAGGVGTNDHVFLQSTREVRATKPREFSTYIPIAALEFRIPGWTYLVRNVWSTYGNGIQDMFVKPSDVGSLRVMSAGNGSYRPVMASAFNQSSSRDFKENISVLHENGLDVINGLKVVTYNLKDDVQKEVQVGLIAEDSLKVASLKGDSINLYKLTTYNTKAIQELDSNIHSVTQQLTTMANSRLQHSLLLESKLLSLEETVVQLKQEIEQLRTA